MNMTVSSRFAGRTAWTFWSASLFASCLFLGGGGTATAQSGDNPLMAGRGGDVNFPISCGPQIQPRFDAALARQLEDDMIAHNSGTGLRSRWYNLAAAEARWALERHDWAAAATLPLRPNRYPYAEAIPHFARAIGLARSGHPDEAQAEVDQLAATVQSLTDAKLPYWAGQVEIERKIASGWSAHARGHGDEALALMQAAAAQEDGLEVHDTVNPGPIGMTADEALGTLLLALTRPAEAFKAFEASLRVAKNRLASYAGAASAAAAANDVENARNYYAKVIELTRDGNGDRPEVAEAKAYMKHAAN